MLLLACHNCGTSSTYTVHLQELIIHEQGEKKDMEISQRQFFALKQKTRIPLDSWKWEMYGLLYSYNLALLWSLTGSSSSLRWGEMEWGTRIYRTMYSRDPVQLLTPCDTLTGPGNMLQRDSTTWIATAKLFSHFDKSRLRCLGLHSINVFFWF